MGRSAPSSIKFPRGIKPRKLKLTLNFNFYYTRVSFEEHPLIVCHCEAVSEHNIREAVKSGARSCRQVARACEAGRSCGGCRPLIREIIAEESDTISIFSPLEELALSSS